MSEEARRQLTKYKIFKPGNLKTVRELQTTARLASETEFEFEVRKEPPPSRGKGEVITTEMDLFWTVKVSEKIDEARVKRKLARVREEQSNRMVKLSGFLEAVKTDNAQERSKLERGLQEEY